MASNGADVRYPVAAVAVALTLALTASPTVPAVAAKRADDYQRAYRIGLDAYTYGLPLMTTNATFHTMTSTDVPQGAFGPVNQFNSVRSPNSSSSTAVVAPGATSLSSIAWVDLTGQPQVLHVPKVTGHYFVLAFIDPYTTNLVNLGSASKTPPGDYVIRDPRQRGVALPPGTQPLNVDYSRIWIIGSTQLKGLHDLPAVNAIQDRYTLTSLSDFVSGTVTPQPAPTRPTITPYVMPTGVSYFDTMGALLEKFPPPARDASELRSLATVGIGPGLTPSQNANLSAGTKRGLADAVAAGSAMVQKQTESVFAAGFNQHNGYLLGGFGRYGTDYVKRAVISQVGLGAFISPQAMYAMTWTDHARRALNGSDRYVLRMPKGPPTREGWSITVYNLQGALMANPIDRYAFTNISSLTKNRDGSIDIYVQANAPKKAARRANWLPVTRGQGFEITWRLFAPKQAAIPKIRGGSGWQPPRVVRRGLDGQH